MGLASLTSYTAGTVLTASALNNNENALLNQLNGNIEAVNLASLAVTTAKINTDAVTFDKIDDDGNFGPFTGIWEFDGAVNFDGAVDFDSTVDLSGATILGATPLIFEGSTDNAFETSFAITNPTADRTVTFPDEDVSLGQQCIKGWITFDGTSGSIGSGADSFNVSSVTDNGAGEYTINWSTAFGNANYAVVGMSRRQSGTAGTVVNFDKDTPPTTSACKINCLQGSSLVDESIISVIAIGDR